MTFAGVADSVQAALLNCLERYAWFSMVPGSEGLSAMDRLWYIDVMYWPARTIPYRTPQERRRLEMQ